MTRRSAYAMVLVLAVSVPTATVAESPSPRIPSGVWPGFRGGPAHDGIGTDGPKGQPVLRWRYQAQGAANADIAVGDGLAFTSTDDGVLHALDVDTGAERWSLDADHAPFGGPLFADGTLYVFDGIGVAHAYDPATGTERWHGAASVGIPSNIEVADGTLFTGTDTGLDAIDASNGSVKWTYTPPAGGGVHSPAIAHGLVYASTDQAGYIAVDEATGEPSWSYDTGTDNVGTAVVADGVAFLGATDDAPGHLTALDARTGAVLWSDDEQLQAPAVADGVAVSAGPIGVVVGHDARSGKELWRTPISDSTRTAIIGDGVAYIAADTQHKVYALDTATGKVLWHFDVDGGLDCCVSVADGAVYAGTGLGGIFAIGGSDNPAVVPSSGPVASPATAPVVTGAPVAPPVSSPVAGIPDGEYTTGPLKADEVRAAIKAAGTFEAHGAISHITYDYTLDGDALTIHLASDSLQDPGELAAQSGIYDTAPIARVP